MVPGRQEEKVTPVGEQDLFYLNPFRFGGGVVRALNCVSHADYEGWIFSGRFLPDPLVNAGLRLARPVTDNHKVE
jgi:hypothetical protein